MVSIAITTVAVCFPIAIFIFFEGEELALVKWFLLALMAFYVLFMFFLLIRPSLNLYRLTVTHHQPYAIITDKELQLYDQWSGEYLYMAWGDIAGVLERDGKGGTYYSIELKNYEDFISGERNVLKRLVMRSNSFFTRSVGNIDPRFVDGNVKELLDAIRDNIKY